MRWSVVTVASTVSNPDWARRSAERVESRPPENIKTHFCLLDINSDLSDSSAVGLMPRESPQTRNQIPDSPQCSVRCLAPNNRPLKCVKLNTDKMHGQVRPCFI